MTQPVKPFENIVGKGENAGNQHFLLFPLVFYPLQNKFQIFCNISLVVCTWFQFGPIEKFCRLVKS